MQRCKRTRPTPPNPKPKKPHSMSTAAAEIRTTKLILIIGYNGTGKSTTVKKLLANELKKPEGRALIITPDDMEFSFLPLVNMRFPNRLGQYVKARRMIFEPGTLEYIAQNANRQLVVFDDCRAYLGAATEQALHTLLIRRRQKELDLIAVGHGFTEIPPKLFTFCSDIILFRTMDNIDKRKEVLKDFEGMKAAQARINRHAETNPHYFEWIKQV